MINDAKMIITLLEKLDKIPDSIWLKVINEMEGTNMGEDEENLGNGELERNFEEEE